MQEHAQGEDIITVRDLRKTFGNLTAVDGITFRVKRGEMFAFLGPNGAGKTTTIKMLTTLLHPTSGSMSLDGHDPVREQDAVRRSFGIVFQDPSLDDELTASENMELHGVLYSVPRQLRHERMEQLLNIVDLWDRRNDLVKHFSGGMKRRLEIGRSLLHHPTILFLDEPTVGLDLQTRNHLWEYVGELNEKENVTVFLTTHYMEEADRVADRIAVIDHGKIIAEGSADDLKKTTNAQTLEEAFHSLTGHAIREEEAGALDTMRMARQMWRGRGKGR
ncbi:ATP-binding cassette domain-containing protein [Candidatus Peregrinibacteria bacterium]|nr:ATP-binding cassette domain-containing protein [Candidatus Peregrinibacteria bacterium]MBI3816998.1 ATP-binding cassette domain-containing protein [Candidatus Peregrinibacteria bacterium]